MSAHILQGPWERPMRLPRPVYLHEPRVKKRWGLVGLAAMCFALAVMAGGLFLTRNVRVQGSESLPFGVVAVCAWSWGPNPAGLPVCGDTVVP